MCYLLCYPPQTLEKRELGKFRKTRIGKLGGRRWDYLNTHGELRIRREFLLNFRKHALVPHAVKTLLDVHGQKRQRDFNRNQIDRLNRVTF